MKEKIAVFITTGSEEEALAIARGLLEERLIACANIIGQVRSVYRWKGEVCDDSELMLVCKTQSHLFDDLCEKTKTLHSYEVPEIIAVPLVAGFQPYMQWIEDETL